MFKKTFLFILLCLSLTLPSVASAALFSNTTRSSIQSGLVGWWTFDGGDMTATAAIDKSTTLNAASITGAMVKVPGKLGQTLRWTGATNYLSAPDNDAYTVTNLSFGAWIKTSSATTQIIGEHLDGTEGYGIYVASDGTLHGYGTFSASQDDATGKVVRDGKWHHVMMVRNDDADKRYYFVDGVMVAQFDDTQTTTASATAALIIGARTNGGLNYVFNGNIDDLRLFSRPLSADEVYSLYQYGSAKINVSSQAVANQGGASNLVGHWTFNGGDMTATTAFDKSGSGNTLTANAGQRLAGKVGQAYGARATSADRASAVQSGSLNSFSTQTVSLWVRTPVPSAAQIALRKTSNAPQNVYQLDTNGSKFRYIVGVAGVLDVATSNTTVVANKWYHVVGTYDGTKVRLYVNGVEDATPQDQTGTINTGTTNSMFLMGDENGTNLFSGIVDDVRIYSRALSADEVYSLYKYGGAKITINSQAVANQGTTNGLTGYWTFNGADTINGTTKTFLDKGSYNIVATTSNATLTPGKVGQGTSYNGTNSRTTTNLSSNYNLTASDFTYSHWMRSTQTAFATMGGVRDTTGTAQNVLVLTGINLTANKPSVFYWAATSQSFAGNTTVNDGKWHLITVTYTNGGAMKLYVDGKFDNQATPSGSAGNVDKKMNLGSNINTGDSGLQFFNGQIDDTRLYSRALSANEVYNLYMYGK